MASPDDQDRLQAYLDGELSPAETALLETQLKSNRALAEALLLLAREEAVLGEWARVADRTKWIDAQLVLHRPQPSLVRTWFPAALAASLMLALGVTFWSRQTATPTVPALAKVEHSVGRVYVVAGGVRSAVATGSPLFSGQGLEVLGDESSAVVIYSDGTRLEFDGDTVVTEFTGGATGGKRVVLAEGNLRAEVAKQPPGKPMVLKTANAEVTVLGTKFDLSGSTQVTHVETTEGSVRLTRAGDGRSIEVPAGFEGRADGEPDMNAQLSPPRFHQPQLTTSGNHRTTALSPDGQTLVTTRFGFGKVTFWNVSTGRERLTFEAHAAQVDSTAFSVDGLMFATGAADRTIKLWNPTTGRLLQTLIAPEHLQAIAFADDGKLLAALAGMPQRGLHLHTWNLTTNQLRGEPQALSGEAWAFSTSGRLLAISSARDVSVTVWDVVAGRERAAYRRLPGGRIFCLAISPDDSRLAISDRSGRVALWNIDAPERVQEFYPPGGSVQGLSFSPDGASLALGLRFATVRVWDLATGKQRFVLEGDRRPGSTATVRPMFFTPDGKTLATTQSLDESIVRLWDLPTQE